VRPCRPILALVAVAVLTAPATAQRAPGRLPTDEQLREVEVSPALESLADALDSDDYGVREGAMDQMLAMEPSVNELCSILLDRSLSAEARYRLLAILRERVLYTPRGAVGIEADQLKLARDEVVIASVLEDMPAAGVLRAGDRILELDDQPLRDWPSFVEEIQMHLPGDRVALTLERPDRTTGRSHRLRLVVTLGSAEERVGPDGQPRIRNVLASRRASLVKQAQYRFGVETLEIADARASSAPAEMPRLHPSPTGD
jgi:hypothetical protein